MNKLFENFDKLNNTKTSKIHEGKRRMFEHRNQIYLVGDDANLNESDDNEEREEVLSHIKNNNFESDPKEFYESMKGSKHEEMLTPYSVSELSQMKLFKVPGYDIGYALKKKDDKTNKYNEIVAVHNNEENIKRIGDELIQSAVKNGGCYLDHFDGYLSKFYERHGLDVEINKPYSGSFYPLNIKGEFETIMIEVNKELYMIDDKIVDTKSVIKLNNIINNIFSF